MWVSMNICIVYIIRPIRIPELKTISPSLVYLSNGLKSEAKIHLFYVLFGPKQTKIGPDWLGLNRAGPNSHSFGINNMPNRARTVAPQSGAVTPICEVVSSSPTASGFSPRDLACIVSTLCCLSSLRGRILSSLDVYCRPCMNNVMFVMTSLQQVKKPNRYLSIYLFIVIMLRIRGAPEKESAGWEQENGGGA